MPLNIDLVQILLHMLNFTILAGGLTYLLFKPVNKFLTERREHFERLEKESAEEKQNAEAMRAEYEARMAKATEEIDAMRAEAEREMARTSKEYIEEAKAKANTIVTLAEQEAETRKEHILDSAQTEISELVVAATQKLLSDTVTPESDSELYDEFIRLADGAISYKRAKK